MDRSRRAARKSSFRDGWVCGRRGAHVGGRHVERPPQTAVIAPQPVMGHQKRLAPGLRGWLLGASHKLEARPPIWKISEMVHLPGRVVEAGGKPCCTVFLHKPGKRGPRKNLTSGPAHRTWHP